MKSTRSRSKSPEEGKPDEAKCVTSCAPALLPFDRRKNTILVTYSCNKPNVHVEILVILRLETVVRRITAGDQRRTVDQSRCDHSISLRTGSLLIDPFTSYVVVVAFSFRIYPIWTFSVSAIRISSPRSTIASPSREPANCISHRLTADEYRSTILIDTLNPTWTDEEWIVRNIPLNAKLVVSIYDRDDDTPNDDYIGQFEIKNLATYQSPDQGHTILDAKHRPSGSFRLTIESSPSPESSRQLPRYTFDGPCRYSRHGSSSFGRLTSTNDNRIYFTWKIHIRRLFAYFRPHDVQPWNRQYDVAQSIFSGTPRSLMKQNGFKLAHKMLYGRTMKNNASGRLRSAADLWKEIFFDEKSQRIRACIYTYIIDDHTWRFSETGVGFFTDYASKHALHANCSEYVRYAGQFHPRPTLGWDRCDGPWELVFDNWSGTYAPSLTLLDNLKDLLEFNFPGLTVLAYDFKNPLVKESMEQLKSAVERQKDSPSVADAAASKHSS